MDCLEELVFRDTVREALALLTPDELLMATGRAQGMSDRMVAEMLDIEPAAVSSRLARARERIAADIPELRVFLDGRRKARFDRGTPKGPMARPVGATEGMATVEREMAGERAGG